MLKNYLIIAFRNLKRHALYSTINILGLAVGMACCFLILLHVRHELSYDRYHENAGRIYRLEVRNSAKAPAPWSVTGSSSDVSGNDMMFNQKPIFIVAFARGGSNILLNLLRSHPEVCSPRGETHEVFRGKGDDPVAQDLANLAFLRAFRGEG